MTSFMNSLDNSHRSLRVRQLGRVAPLDLDAVVSGLVPAPGVDYLLLVTTDDPAGAARLVTTLTHDDATVWVYAEESHHFDFADARCQFVATMTGATDYAEIDIQSASRHRDIAVATTEPKPKWMRAKAHLGEGYRSTRNLMKSLKLNTVCEEAGCPNIFECWADRTATFMILGDRCTRACGFCLVDTRKPQPPDRDEPQRVASAAATLGLEHVVITCVARDDLADGGASAFAATILAVRQQSPSMSVEVLISDCQGNPDSLATIFSARPDVLNHNLETVLRRQRSARPSASYARSLAVLARAKAAGLRTKSGVITGLGETMLEMKGAVADLRAVGVDILTIGQYLQPSAGHLPVARWWTPAEFAEIGAYATSLGFMHVESGPLVRSSYHAKRALARDEVSAAL